MADGMSTKGNSLRTSGTIQSTTKTGAGRMSLSRLRSRRGGRSAGAMTSATGSRFPARGGRSTMTAFCTGSLSCMDARRHRTRASSGTRISSLRRSAGSSGRMRGSKGRTLSASLTRHAGRRIAGRASCRPQRNTAYIFRRATTNALRGGCNATTGCSLTRMDTRACMYLQGARRLSGQSQCSCMTSTEWRIWIRKWRITARTNGDICACRGRSSRRYRQKRRRCCLIRWIS